MNTFFNLYLFLLGTMFGSFASVIVYRLRSKEKGIISGRSHCPTCNKALGIMELIPIVSWAINKGKCYYCKEKVSAIYPALEITTGILFAFIGYFLIDFNLILGGSRIEIFKLFFWLFVGFISIAYSFYDILFLEIHDGMMISGLSLIIATIGIQTIFPKMHIISSLPAGINDFGIGLISIFLSIIIIGLLYTIMFKELKEIYDIAILVGIIFALYLFKLFFSLEITSIAILNGTIGALAIYIFFYFQILLSGGKWLGGGDLRIAIMVGLLLGTGFSYPGMMLVYLAGSIIGISLILISKIKNGYSKKFDTTIPFGPFLAIGFFTTIFMQDHIVNFIEIYFNNM